MSYLSKELTFLKGKARLIQGLWGSVYSTPPPRIVTASPTIAPGALLLPAAGPGPGPGPHFRAPDTQEPYLKCPLCSSFTGGRRWVAALRLPDSRRSAEAQEQKYQGPRSRRATPPGSEPSPARTSALPSNANPTHSGWSPLPVKWPPAPKDDVAPHVTCTPPSEVGTTLGSLSRFRACADRETASWDVGFLFLTRQYCKSVTLKDDWAGFVGLETGQGSQTVAAVDLELALYLRLPSLSSVYHTWLSG